MTHRAVFDHARDYPFGCRCGVWFRDGYELSQHFMRTAENRGNPTRGVSSSNVPGGSRVSAETRSDPTVRTERFIAYVERMMGALVLDAPGRVTEVLNRAVLENYRTIARGEYELIRSSLEFGVEVLRRKPELLADLLASCDGYEKQRVLVVSVEPPEQEWNRGAVKDAVVRVAESAAAADDET